MNNRILTMRIHGIALTLPACVPLFSQIIQQTQISDDGFAVN